MFQIVLVVYVFIIIVLLFLPRILCSHPTRDEQERILCRGPTSRDVGG